MVVESVDPVEAASKCPYLNKQVSGAIKELKQDDVIVVQESEPKSNGNSSFNVIHNTIRLM